MKVIKSIMLFPILALLVFLPGCSRAGALISDELLQEILTYGNNMSSYRIEGTMTMSSSGQTGFTVSADFLGELDTEDMNMYMDMNMDMAGDSADTSMASEMYLFSDVFYEESRSIVSCMQFEIDGESTGWMSMAMPYTDMPFAEWEANDQLVQQLETMSSAEVRHAGSETVNGIDCYVFNINLNMDELLDVVLQQPGMEDALQGIDTNALTDMITNLTLKEWISKDSSLLMKAETDMRFSIEGDSVDMHTSMIFYDHNVPLDITLPDECPTWPPPIDEVLTN